jgi:hypothetical protein
LQTFAYRKKLEGLRGWGEITMRKPCLSASINIAPEIEEIEGRFYWRTDELPIEHYNMSLAVAMEIRERLDAAIEGFRRRQRAQIVSLYPGVTLLKGTVL